MWQATTVAYQTLNDLESEYTSDYEDRYADPHEAKALEEDLSRVRREIASLVASRDKLVAAVVALSEDREESVRKRFSHELD